MLRLLCQILWTQGVCYYHCKPISLYYLHSLLLLYCRVKYPGNTLLKELLDKKGLMSNIAEGYKELQKLKISHTEKTQAVVAIDKTLANAQQEKDKLEEDVADIKQKLVDQLDDSTEDLFSALQ